MNNIIQNSTAKLRWFYQYILFKYTYFILPNYTFMSLIYVAIERARKSC
jgi:hypothetical protein